MYAELNIENGFLLKFFVGKPVPNNKMIDMGLCCCFFFDMSGINVSIDMSGIYVSINISGIYVFIDMSGVYVSIDMSGI